MVQHANQPSRQRVKPTHQSERQPNDDDIDLTLKKNNKSGGKKEHIKS